MGAPIKRVMHVHPIDEKYEYFAEKGILYLEDEVDEATTSMFCLDIFYRHSTLPEGAPIGIVLNSPGGFVHHGLGIYDAIEAVVEAGRQVNILGLGMVASMATVILQAGTRRFSFPNTQFLLHQVSETIIFKREEVSEGEERITESKRLNDIVMGIIAERSGIPVEDVKKICKKTDFWLDTAEARKFGSNGLIDEVSKSWDCLTKTA